MLDLLIGNARVCDGSGARSFVGDLGGKHTGAMPGRILRSYE